MSTIAPLVMIAMLSSLALAALAYAVADRAEALSGQRFTSVSVWRLARLAALLPLLVAIAAPALPASGLLTARSSNSTALSVDSRIPGTAAGEDAPGSARLDVRPEVSATSQPAAPSPAVPGGEGSLPSLLDAARAEWIAVFADATSLLFLVLYCVGLAGALTGFLLNRLSIARLLARSRPAEGPITDLLADWAGRLGLAAGAVRLWTSEAAGSPFLTGLKPTIVFPRTLAEKGHGRTGEYALVHELVHARRGDERDRLLGEFLGVFLWFNPVFARIERRLSLAREMACDAETLAVLGRRANARAYARALIDVPWVERPGADIISAFGLSVGKVRKMRIKAILANSGERDGQALFAVAAAAALSIAIVPVAAAQALVSASLAGEPAAVSARATVAVVQSQAATPVRRAIEASPFKALEQLERLEALEALDDIDPRQVLLNPANWASIMGVASGSTDPISLTIQDANGNPVDIRADVQGRGDARIEFTDETGDRLAIDVVGETEDGREEVTIGVVNAAHPLIHVISAGSDTELRFLDQRERPVFMSVRESGEAAAVLIEDVDSRARSEFVFVDSDPEIYAPAAGRVRAVGTDAPGPDSAGQYVVLDHATGWSTIFYNLDAVQVARGETVAQGDLIAQGRSRGDGIDLGPLGQDSAINASDMTIVRTADLDL
ncbi:hypothetical protein E5163_11025 [Marinicauda algicola]|uniref:Peptidase M56 domain-containing protein n=1 Tax=Marinicauda algicola TaxID=2029849 RepID=A0A4S2GYU1_9PROT|nr:M56 family metallopeptidase [Marinicauda algicola]TGY88345.1 hypothetical protein E5163_11025 [Marinicauda algicola]